MKTVGQIVSEMEESLPKWLGADPAMANMPPEEQLTALQGAADYIRFVRLNLPHALQVYDEQTFLDATWHLWKSTVED